MFMKILFVTGFSEDFKKMSSEDKLKKMSDQFLATPFFRM